MNGSHYKNTSCSFDGDLIGYLYEEDSPSEKRRVEEHLRTCGDCSNEFAELSMSRLAVSDWRNTEFNDLVTPRFVLPVVTSENKRSKWSLSSIFGGWKLPASAFAAAAILVAFGTV